MLARKWCITSVLESFARLIQGKLSPWYSFHCNAREEFDYIRSADVSRNPTRVLSHQNQWHAGEGRLEALNCFPGRICAVYNVPFNHDNGKCYALLSHYCSLEFDAHKVIDYRHSGRLNKLFGCSPSVSVLIYLLPKRLRATMTFTV